MRLECDEDDTSHVVDISSVMCGCEINPLTKRGHYLQLLFMVSLPLIPVTALVVHSLMKLVSTHTQFAQLQVCLLDSIDIRSLTL